MCEPMTILTIASTVVSYMAAEQKAAAEQNAIRANAEQRNATVAEQYRQTQMAATDKMSARAREGAIELAHLKTVAGESGLAGVSAERTQAESQFNSGTDITSIENNRANQMKQIYLQGKSGQAMSTSQLNAIQQPNLYASGLQIAGAYVNSETEKQKQRGVTTAAGTPSS